MDGSADVSPARLSVIPRTFTPWNTSRLPASTQPIRVLVVDADGVSRVFIDKALRAPSSGDGAPIEVELTKNATAALDILQSSVVDVLIVDTELPEMPGIRFLALLRREVRYHHLGVIFHSADSRAETKVALFAAGADDVVDKPEAPALLRARVRAVAARGRRPLLERGEDALRGSSSVLSLADLASIFELSRRSGRLSIQTTRAHGAMVFHDGAVYSTRYGNLEGEEAFYAVVLESADYSFTPETVAPSNRSISAPTSALILEAARRADEGVTPSVVAPARTILGGAPVPAAETPSIEVARLIEGELGSDLLLGDIMLRKFSPTVPAASPPRSLRFVLFAPLDVAVAGFLAASVPPSEHALLAALSPGARWLTTSFRSRTGWTVEVVACGLDPSGDATREPSDAGRLPDRLKGAPPLFDRAPAGAIVIPPGGSFSDLGFGHRVLLDDALNVLLPAFVLGVGNTTLQSKLFELDAIRSGRCALRVIGLGETRTAIDLKQILRAAIGLWTGVTR